MGVSFDLGRPVRSGVAVAVLKAGKEQRTVKV